MTPPTVYTFDKNGVLTGSQPAVQSPKDKIGVWLMPAQSTLTAPPTVPAGQKAVFNASTQVWGSQPE